MKFYFTDKKNNNKSGGYREIIRHGSIDRDTSLAISAMLTAKLENQKVNVNLRYPWGKRHAGDYDLDELFSWIDSLK